MAGHVGNSNPAGVEITIGGHMYQIPPGRIPYVDAFIRVHQGASLQSGCSDAPITHGPIELFDVAWAGIEGGYRQCFRRLEPELSQFDQLCHTYERLMVDVVAGRTIGEIGEAIKSRRTEYELEYKQYRPIRGNKNRARDAVFVLLYVILLNELEDTPKVSNQFYSLVLFVLSHRATFKSKARSVLWQAYTDRFTITAKQRAQLESRRAKDQGFEEGEDLTTADEGTDSGFDFDSDPWD